jgi:hypothetical protein
MTTLAPLPSPADRQAPDPTHALVGDERGAVMVVGIVMCTCLVGALWYLAGIGDAIVYRERLQEAADATAFSGAVLHARGMNLIVLINLVMACVLAVRVAMKVVQLTLVFAAAVFGAFSWICPPCPGIALKCVDGARMMQNLINNTRNMIDNTLKVLSKVELGIKYATPVGSIAGSYQIAEKYRPPISRGFAGTSVDRYANGLPVKEGTTDRLCFEAGEAVGKILLSLIPIDALKDENSWVGGKFAGLMGKIAKAGGGYFCELGGKGGPPDLTDLINQGADEGCDDKLNKLRDDYNKANTAWTTKCAEFPGVVCNDSPPVDEFGYKAEESIMTGYEKLTPAQQSELKGLQGTRDAASRDVEGFRKADCVEKQKKEMSEKFKSAVPPATQGSPNGKTPKMVEDNWKNGVKDAQVLAWVWGNGKLLKVSPGGVKIGAMGSRRAGDIEEPAGADFAFAQAEFFYDCSGPWKDEDCNGKEGDGEESMWHFRWRARLRRYNSPYSDLPEILELKELYPAQLSFQKRAAEALAYYLVHPSAADPRSVELKAELGRIAVHLPKPDTKIYAIH